MRGEKMRSRKYADEENSSSIKPRVGYYPPNGGRIDDNPENEYTEYQDAAGDFQPYSGDEGGYIRQPWEEYGNQPEYGETCQNGEVYDGEKYPESYYDEPSYDGQNENQTYYEDEPVNEEYADEYFDEDDEEGEISRQAGWQAAAGVGNFFSTIVGCVVILLLIGVLAALLSWVHGDLIQSFAAVLKK